jgi:tRNA A-37 threonylcarbamoyl transferase component Bud32
MSNPMELNGNYIHPHWRLTLNGLGLNTIADWLALDKTLVDEPNQRGRGISQVFQASVVGAGGEPVTVYIKHQRNYVRRSVLHPITGQATLYQEYRALMRCWQAGVPVAEPLFFAVNSQGGSHEAMLVSLNLAGFQSLDQIDLGALSPRRRFALIRDVAAVVRLLHERGLVHQNLYPKHIFVVWCEKQQCYDARFIDMERCRPHHQRWQPRLRDLETLARRAKGFSARDRVRFLRAYLARSLADSEGRSLMARMERKFKLRSA